jgi:hypothetical protein
MAVLASSQMTVLVILAAYEQRNEAIRLGSDGSPGFMAGYRPGWKYRGNTEQRNKP